MMDKPSIFSVNPEAELEPRPTDVAATVDELRHLSLFRRLKRVPVLERFPGATVLRRYQAGEVIYHQGEPGWTSFYALSTEDALSFLQRRLEEILGGPARPALPAEVERLRQLDRQLRAAPQTDELRKFATIQVAYPRRSPAGPTGWLARFAALFGGAPKPPGPPPGDASASATSEIREAALYEGELFSELTRVPGSPRTATVVATRDCYVLEMLPSILEQLTRDEAFRAHLNEVYRQRTLEVALRAYPLFRDLTDQQFARLRDGVELVSFDSGAVVFDEYEPADCMYLIRSGLVRVMKNASALLSVAHVKDWQLLGRQLRDCEPASGPRRHLWQLLGEPARALVRRGEGTLTAADRQTLVTALNEIIKSPKFADAREVEPATHDPGFRARLPELPARRKDWTGRDVRVYSRLLLETLCPETLVPFRAAARPPQVLAYRSAGEVLGEMGVLLGEPRGESCVAHVIGTGRAGVATVELVRLPRSLLLDLMAGSPEFRRHVEEIAARRAQQLRDALVEPGWEDSARPLLSKRFDELGMIQGQKLMLIDLDRCTRCDDCVRACTDTHDDGVPRLVLDGPRFGKYLVPTTCRSCLDPVCMIGCPVGCMYRGDNRQIVIEDWCIGCGLCADNCPYGAIQMQDVGIVPEGSRGWRYCPAAGAPADWYQPDFRDHRWLPGDAPFFFDPDLRAALLDAGGPVSPPGSEPEQAVCFRSTFRLDGRRLRPESLFRLELTSTDAKAAVWLNGQQLRPDAPPRRGRREYSLAPAASSWAKTAPPAGAATGVLRAGRNVLAVRAAGTPRLDERLLDVRLDEVRQPKVTGSSAAEVVEKLTTHLAVTCDLCSDLPAQIPACVHACPHDAAMRVDARVQFPAGFGAAAAGQKPDARYEIAEPSARRPAAPPPAAAATPPVPPPAPEPAPATEKQPEPATVVRPAAPPPAGDPVLSDEERAFSSQTIPIYYPAPIALAYQRYRSQQDLGTKLLGLFAAVEATLRYLVTLAVSDLWHCLLEGGEKQPKLPSHSDLDFLRRPRRMQLGQWVGALREAARHLGRQPRPFFEELPRVCAPGGALDGRLLDWLVRTRNRCIHEEGSITITVDEIKELLPKVRQKLEEALQEVRFVCSYGLGFVLEDANVPVQDPGQHPYRVHSCMGARMVTEGTPVDAPLALRPRLPFVVAPDQSRLLYLWPLLAQRVSPHANRPTLYAFEKITHEDQPYLTEIRSHAVDVKEDVWVATLHDPAPDHGWLLDELRGLPVVQALPADFPLADRLLPARAGLLVGKWLGPNHLKSLIARGGFASIYYAETQGDETTDEAQEGKTGETQKRKAVAVKVLEPWTLEGGEFLRFKQEFEKLLAARHPAILPCHEMNSRVINDIRYTWYSMAYAVGGDLNRRIDQRRGRAGEKAPWLVPELRREIIEDFRTILAAVGYLHAQDVVHRDIKPGNILVLDDGKLQLADFGLVKVLSASRRPESPLPLTSRGAIVGTPYYRSPEQQFGRPAGKPSDVYSLGILLTELATGTRPAANYHVENDSTLAGCRALDDLPPPLQRFLRRCTHENPEQRFADAEALAGEFAGLVEQLSS
jgi:Fe-S-cluster-containing hydrogenase component 2/CRP-like cAMP-binding protein